MNQLLRSALAAWRENRTLTERRAGGARSSSLSTHVQRKIQNKTVHTHIALILTIDIFINRLRRLSHIRLLMQNDPLYES